MVDKKYYATFSPKFPVGCIAGTISVQSESRNVREVCVTVDLEVLCVQMRMIAVMSREDLLELTDSLLEGTME